MIVQPDFPDHWKTRLLIKITGDKSSPLALIRLWGYCQTSKTSHFPDMTPAQLASICFWGELKPACHQALLKCKFIEKLSPSDFRVHQWNEYNAKLLANWENGKLGGRPKIEQNANKNDVSEKPVGSGGVTQSKPIEQIDQIDKIRTEQMDTKMGSGSLFSVGVSSSSVLALADAIAKKSPAIANTEAGLPTLAQVVEHIKQVCPSEPEKCADKWIKDVSANGWKDHRCHTITDWRPLARSFASAWERNNRGVSRTTHPDRNAGTFNAKPLSDAAKSKIR